MSGSEDSILPEHRMQEYWKPHFVDGAKISLEYIESFDRSKVLLVRSDPPEPMGFRPVFFIPGWFSLISGWTNVIKEVSRNTTVYYFESREKGSSILLDTDVSMGIPQMAEDLNEVLSTIDNIGDLVVVSSSMGGTILFEYFGKNMGPTPFNTIMIGPNPEFDYPKLLALVVLNLPVRVLSLGKKIVRWYVVRYRLDPVNEPEQVKKYEEVLENADPWKIKYSARQCLSFKAWDLLPKISAPITLVGASKDKLHAAETVVEIAEQLPHATYIDFESNKRSHSPEMGQFILEIASYE